MLHCTSPPGDDAVRGSANGDPRSAAGCVWWTFGGRGGRVCDGFPSAAPLCAAARWTEWAFRKGLLPPATVIRPSGHGAACTSLVCRKAATPTNASSRRSPANELRSSKTTEQPRLVTAASTSAGQGQLRRLLRSVGLSQTSRAGRPSSLRPSGSLILRRHEPLHVDVIGLTTPSPSSEVERPHHGPA
jgi:hypothetical protein